MRTVTSSGRATVSLCARAQVHAVRCVERAVVRTARPPGFRQERDRAVDLPRQRQPCDARCAGTVQRPCPRCGLGRPQRDRRRAEGDARCRSARHAFQFCQTPGGCHAARSAGRDRKSHRTAGLACGGVFRGAGSARVVGFLHHVADHGGGRSHGTSRCEQTGRRARVRVVHKTVARASEHLVEGELPGAAKVGPGTAQPTTMWCRLPDASSRLFRTVCCGVPTGRIRT